MFTDEELLVISNKIDIFLSTLAVEHQVPALELSAVILAGLILLNNEFQNQKDFVAQVVAVAAIHLAWLHPIEPGANLRGDEDIAVGGAVIVDLKGHGVDLLWWGNGYEKSPALHERQQ